MYIILVIVILVSGYEYFNLWQKNQYWHDASGLAQKTLQNLAVEINKNQFAGVVIFGLPDNYHGASLFRNMFAEGLHSVKSQYN